MVRRFICAILQSAKKNVCEINLCQNRVQNECTALDLFESCVGLEARKSVTRYISDMGFCVTNYLGLICDN